MPQHLLFPNLRLWHTDGLVAYSLGDAFLWKQQHLLNEALEKLFLWYYVHIARNLLLSFKVLIHVSGNRSVVKRIGHDLGRAGRPDISNKNFGQNKYFGLCTMVRVPRPSVLSSLRGEKNRNRLSRLRRAEPRRRHRVYHHVGYETLSDSHHR